MATNALAPYVNSTPSFEGRHILTFPDWDSTTCTTLKSKFIQNANNFDGLV